MSEVFRSAFTEADLIDGATVDVISGTYVKLGEYIVTAGEAIAIGYGGETGMDNAQGRIFCLLKDDVAGAIDGILRLVIYSPQDRPLMILDEFRTETLNTNATDRTKQVPFPLHGVGASRDKKLVLELKSDTTATLTKANCDLIMDITRFTV